MPDPVLIVEAEEILRQELVRSLVLSGVGAVGAGTIDGARALLADREFALVCIDIEMTDGAGIELIPLIRASQPEVPVIVTTGQDCVASRLRAEHAGVVAFLARPFALSRFRELVRTLLGERAVASLPGRPAGNAPRMLMYSHDTIGLGHMRRNSAIAAEVVRAMPGASVLMLVGSPAGVVFDLPPGVDFVKLPSLAKVSRNVWRPGSLRIPSGETRDLRAGLIGCAAEAFRPDLVLVDHEALGVWEELSPTLEALRRRDVPPRVVLGLRDILDDPGRVRADWDERALSARIRELYDDILVYGCRELFDTAHAYGLDDLAPVSFCGYVTGAPVPAIRPPETAANGGPRIVVAGGGGRDAYPMMRAALDALAGMPARVRHRAVMVAGPLMDEELRARLGEGARAAGMSFLTSTPDVPAYLREADFFVAMGGYNSLTEALAAGCPTLAIPRVGPSSEQRLRARLFAERGLIETIAQDLVTPEVLAERFRQVRPGAERQRPALDLGGARAAADHIVGMLADRASGAAADRRRSLHA